MVAGDKGNKEYEKEITDANHQPQTQRWEKLWEFLACRE